MNFVLSPEDTCRVHPGYKPALKEAVITNTILFILSEKKKNAYYNGNAISKYTQFSFYIQE